MDWISLRCRVCLASLVLLLSLAGCSDQSTKPKPTPQGGDETSPRVTWMGVIDLLAEAHKDRDLTKYTECLHPDFVFEFSEQAVDDPSWDWTASIDKAEDLTVTANMFAWDTVTDVSVDFANLTSGADTAGFRVSEIAVGEDTVIVYWGLFQVDVHVLERTPLDWIDHWIEDTACVYLRPDPADTTLWTIWRIEDHGTWSRIKAMFRS